MTRRHLMTLRLILILLDGVITGLVFLLVSALRFGVDPDAQWSVRLDVNVAALFFAILWIAVLWALGLYRLGARWSLFAEARDLARATIAVLAITLSVLFILHQDDVSRVFLAILFVAQPAASLAVRTIARAWFDGMRRRGHSPSYMLVVGTGELAQAFADRVEARADLGVRVVGHLSVPDAGDQPPTVARPVLGTVDDLERVFRTRVIDEVAVCLPPAAAHYLDPVVAIAAEEGKTVRVPADIEESILTTALHEEFDGYLVRSIIHDGHRDLELALKRLVDIVGAVVGLVVLSPILLVTAVFIRLRDGSPILFRQTRIGRHGRPFTIYKFRTMVPDAEERHAELKGRSNTRGAAFKMADDPRVTPAGRFLRAASIDELPQLFNVLKGDMSLVGPRPAPPREVDQYDIWHRRRLSMRPGLTGLWQIGSRFDEHFDDRAELDLRYIDQWSLLMDLGILARTIPAVLAREGR